MTKHEENGRKFSQIESTGYISEQLQTPQRFFVDTFPDIFHSKSLEAHLNEQVLKIWNKYFHHIYINEAPIKTLLGHNHFKDIEEWLSFIKVHLLSGVPSDQQDTLIDKIMPEIHEYGLMFAVTTKCVNQNQSKSESDASPLYQTRFDFYPTHKGFGLKERVSCSQLEKADGEMTRLGSPLCDIEHIALFEVDSVRSINVVATINDGWQHLHAFKVVSEQLKPFMSQETAMGSVKKVIAKLTGLFWAEEKKDPTWVELNMTIKKLGNELGGKLLTLQGKQKEIEKDWAGLISAQVKKMSLLRDGINRFNALYSRHQYMLKKHNAALQTMEVDRDKALTELPQTIETLTDQIEGHEKTLSDEASRRITVLSELITQHDLDAKKLKSLLLPKSLEATRKLYLERLREHSEVLKKLISEQNEFIHNIPFKSSEERSSLSVQLATFKKVEKSTRQTFTTETLTQSFETSYQSLYQSISHIKDRLALLEMYHADIFDVFELKKHLLKLSIEAQKSLARCLIQREEGLSLEEIYKKKEALISFAKVFLTPKAPKHHRFLDNPIQMSTLEQAISEASRLSESYEAKAKQLIEESCSAYAQFEEGLTHFKRQVTLRAQEILDIKLPACEMSYDGDMTQNLLDMKNASLRFLKGEIIRKLSQYANPGLLKNPSHSKEAASLITEIKAINSFHAVRQRIKKEMGGLTEHRSYYQILSDGLSLLAKEDEVVEPSRLYMIA